MRVVIIDDNVKRRIQEVKAFAEANPYTFDDLLDMMNKQKPKAGDDMRHVVTDSFWRLCSVFD